MSNKLKPLILEAPLKDYIWGGKRLKEEFGKVSDTETIAESWELSCHDSGLSVIAEGEYKGITLKEYISLNRESLGKNGMKYSKFPVLVKLIDACENLSVQVHPDDDYAKKVEGQYGKTEMWYVLDCNENSELIYGFKSAITKEEFRNSIENNTLLEKVNKVKVKKGDVFFINAGNLHAIGKGILVAEIQQSSDCTYRVYDYGRKGADGKPRELHIEKALEVTNLNPSEPYKVNDTVKYDGAEISNLASCNYFKVRKAELSGGKITLENKDSFMHILVYDGEGMIFGIDSELTVKKGTSLFIPANSGSYTFSGNFSFIITESGE